MNQNPWNRIELYEYEQHMSYISIMQSQTLNQEMKDQFASYPENAIIDEQTLLKTLTKTGFVKDIFIKRFCL